MENVEIAIHTEYINLDQLLKYGNYISTGGEVRHLLDQNLITLNDQPVTERRRKIRVGDIVKVKGIVNIKVIAE